MRPVPTAEVKAESAIGQATRAQCAHVAKGHRELPLDVRQPAARSRMEPDLVASDPRIAANRQVLLDELGMHLVMSRAPRMWDQGGETWRRRSGTACGPPIRRAIHGAECLELFRESDIDAVMIRVTTGPRCRAAHVDTGVDHVLLIGDRDCRCDCQC